MSDEEEEEFNEAQFEAVTRKPFNPKALMPGYTWTPGYQDVGKAFVDGSTGFRHGGTACGIAIYWYGHYWGFNVPIKSSNLTEMAALKKCLELVCIRPLTIYTDSSFVQRWGHGRDVKIIWNKRRSSPELCLVDTLSKWCACKAKSEQGVGVPRDVEMVFDAKLMALYDRHYGKGSKHDQSATSLV